MNQPNPIESEGAANRISNPAILKSGSKIEYGKPEVELPDLDDNAIYSIGSHRGECKTPDEPCTCGLAEFRKEAATSIQSLLNKARLEELKRHSYGKGSVSSYSINRRIAELEARLKSDKDNNERG